MIRYLALFIFKVLSKLYFPVTVIGRENVPREGGYILASNHVSNLDPFILGISFGRFFNFMAKEELFKKAVLAFFMRGMMAYPVKRSSADLGAIKETLKRLKAGGAVVMFPEGTRKKKNRDQEVEAGIGLIAVKSGVPVVPVYIEGSQHVLPPGAKRLKRHPVTLKVGPPVKFAEDQTYDSIARDILNAILALKQSSV